MKEQKFLNTLISIDSFDYGIFKRFIDDDLITDINYNGKGLWVDHLNKGRYEITVNINDDEIESFCYRFANYANKQFNNTYPILESETNNLRLSILHKSIALSGYSISIRKTPPFMRLNTKDLIQSEYAPKQLLDFISDLVSNKANIMISGLPGVGKTEFLKYLTSFISDNERVITIEDNLEIRYPLIHRHKDSTMIKVNRIINYRDAIKASLRQRVDWILLSEVRSDEVIDLLQAISTGASLISTIHADNAFEIPNRMLHMFPGNELTNDKLMYRIHESIDYGISIKSVITDQGIHRYIDELCEYTVGNNTYSTKLLYDSKNDTDMKGDSDDSN